MALDLTLYAVGAIHVVKPPFVRAIPAEGERFKPFERDPETLVRRWAVPGQRGFEHRIGGLEKNHSGVLSTDPVNHETMVRERAEKVERVAKDLPLLTVDGPASGKLLVVGWGGTYGHIKSAVDSFGHGEIPFAHFDYICPLPSNTEEVFAAYESILVCELNSGQFADYLRARFPQFMFKKFNKIQGQPFLVNEIVEAIRNNM